MRYLRTGSKHDNGPTRMDLRPIPTCVGFLGSEMKRDTKMRILTACLLILLPGSQVLSFETTPACPYPESAEYGTICVCSKTQDTNTSCGSLPDASTLDETEALIVTSAYDDFFMKTSIVPFTSVSIQSEDAQMNINVRPNTTLQSILGFGGAVTDATAFQYRAFDSDDTRRAFVDTFYSSETGANFTFSRVPMNAADFSRKNYVHAHRLDLSDWCLRDDNEPVECGRDFKLDVLGDIVKVQPSALKVYVSAWSAPPAFKSQSYDCSKVDGLFECEQRASHEGDMNCTRTVSNPDTCDSRDVKQSEPCPTQPPRDVDPATSKDPATNADGNCYNAGFLKDGAAMKSWANFYEKFVKDVNERIAPVTVWGVTTQNEPLTQTGLWGSNFMSAENESTFVGSYLSPTLKRAFGDEFKIMTHDDQVVSLASRALDMARALGDKIDGIAYHWYQALESTFEDTKPEAPLDLPSWIVANKVGGGADVKTVYDALNGDKFLLMTEACSGYSLGTSWVGPRHGEWGYGYATSHDMLWQLKNRAAGWVYWNLLLDERGGPNLAGNYVDSPSYVLNSSSFALNPSFYHMAHFSRFVPPGSVAVDADVRCGARRSEYCQFVAFKRPDSRLVVVMTNDEITVGPIAGTGVGIAATPWLAKGQGSLTLGEKTLSWQINCGANDRVVRGVLPWKSIQTVLC